MKKLYVLILCAVLSAPSSVFAAVGGSCSDSVSPEASAMFMDALFIRPIGLAGTAVGSAVYLVTLPFSVIGGNAGEAGNALVKEPAAYTFARPLGRSLRCNNS